MVSLAPIHLATVAAATLVAQVITQIIVVAVSSTASLVVAILLAAVITVVMVAAGFLEADLHHLAVVVADHLPVAVNLLVEPVAVEINSLYYQLKEYL